VTSPRRPGLLEELGAATLALVLVGIAGWLGYWQYDAWQERRSAEAADLTELAPVPLTDLMGGDDPFPAPDLGRPVEVSGDWLDGGFWVSGREYAGSDGFWAVNPLQVDDAAVLVVRGWAPEADDDLLRVSGGAEVVGWLQPPEGGLVTDADADDDVFPEIRVADAVQRVDLDLYSAYVVADPDRTEASVGLDAAELASLPSPGRFTAVRNLLYAVEWWIFGAFAAFIWWRWRRDQMAA
jgi:cytochrome oxidase assembly protein ShyY1